MELEVKSINGETSGSKFSLDASIFDAAFNEPLVHQVVVAQQAAMRQGTKAQKNRSAVSGGGAKPWRQKGTGRARAGTSRSPLWRSGGNAFPCSPRSFAQKVNRKSYKAALRSILAELNRQERLIVVDSVELESVKTKALAAQLSNLGAENCLLVDVEIQSNLELASRNLPFVTVATSQNVSAVELIAHEKVVITEKAISALQEKLQ